MDEAETSFIATEIDRIVRNELDDCETAIKSGDTHNALSELEDAVRKLKQIANKLR